MTKLINKIFLYFVLFFVVTQAFAKEKKDKKPNIILFFVDDLGWKDLAIMGSDYHESPNIDRLANEGILYKNAYSSGPNSAPSRAAMMSGQYAPRHGKFAVWDSKRGVEDQMRLEPIPDKELPLDNYILAEALRDGGYHTGIFGKWHIANTPSEQGFIVDGETASKVPGFSANNDPKQVYSLTEKACQFMEENQDKPFFLYLAHHSVHSKWEARQETIAEFEQKPKGKIHQNAQYAAMVKHTDDSMGEIMDKLKELDLDDNTIIIFTSDNGAVGQVKQTPLRGAKGMLYEGGIRVPLIMWYPKKIKAGRVSEERVINVDFYPTLLEVAGLDTPKDKVLDGESLTPTFKGKSLKRNSIFFHFPIYLDGKNARGSRDAYFRNRPVTVAINDDWKLLFYHEEYLLDGGLKQIDSNKMVELYNLKEDPSEQTDLANVNTEMRDQLVAEVQAWLKETNAPLAQIKTPENYRPVYKGGDPGIKKKKKAKKK